MSIKELENLARVGQLKQEASAQAEIDTHIQSGRDRLRDACAQGIHFPENSSWGIAQLTPSHWLRCGDMDTGR